MQPISKAISILLYLSVLLTACGPVTAIPATVVAPTKIFVPTTANLPLPSVTATLSQSEKEFLLPTMQEVYAGTPTSIATPEFGSSSLKLKTLSAQDSLDLIYAMNLYSYENYPARGDWWTDGHFVVSQQSVALAIQEYLYHFPQGTNADRLRWQLAFVNSIAYEPLPGNEYDAEWIVSQLQMALDEGITSSSQLELVLDRYWFDVAYVRSIENLFADGNAGTLYVIAPQVWADQENDPKSSDYFEHGGLFVAVREVQPGDFQLFLLKNAWMFSFSDSFVYETSDHNQNGVPEIALYIGAHSGTMCDGHLLIYEWREDSFIELTENNIYLRDCVEDFEYATIDNTPAIKYHGFMPNRIGQYVWDGNHYAFAGYESTSLVDKWWAARSFPEEAEAIEDLLAIWDQEGLSPAQVDFLRFRLGIVHALNSDPAQVKRVLQDLIDNPADNMHTVYSDLAENFLRYYSDNQTLLLACRKSREFFDTVTEAAAHEEELFGTPFDFIFGPGLLRCFEQDAFETVVATIPVTVEDVSAALQNFRANLVYTEKQDVNQDGVTDEWLITFDNSVFVVHPNGNHYEAIRLTDFWYDEEADQYSSVKIRIERWMGIESPILTVVTDQELSIVGIEEDYSIKELGSDFQVNDVIFASQQTPPEYQVFSIKPNPDEDFYSDAWRGYRWDVENQEFRSDLLEYTLFIEHDPEKAFKIAAVLSPFLMDWKDLNEVGYWLPRYLYLCGLSYELAGHPETAAEIYWQIWHDFPGSHYALMARYKLEAGNP